MGSLTVIENYKKVLKLDNYNQVATSLNTSRQKINNYKKGTVPNAETLLDIMEKGGFSATEIKKMLHEKEAGFSSIYVLIGIAGLSGLYFVGITQTAPVQALAQSWTALHCILC